MKDECNSETERLNTEAMEWLARGELTDPREQERFTSWVTRSPQHVSAFLAGKYWRDGLSDALAEMPTDVNQLLAGSDNVIDVGDRVPGARKRMLKLRVPRWVAALAASAAGMAAVALLFVPSARELFGIPSVYETSLGEQRSVALNDGSVVTLNTQSEIRVDFSEHERNIHLDSGQATFAVAHDSARPFRVHVDGGVIEAIGTKFDVRRLGDRTRVAVIEGRVRIRSSLANPAPAQLSAGEGATLLVAGAVTPPSQVDIPQVVAWQQRRLVFVDEPLSNIVDEFHRYTRVRLRVEGEAIGARRYSGVWDADRPDKLLSYLSTYGNLSVDREGEDYVIRAGREASSR